MPVGVRVRVPGRVADFVRERVDVSVSEREAAAVCERDPSLLRVDEAETRVCDLEACEVGDWVCDPDPLTL